MGALYYIDNISYLQYGKPISEFEYIKQPFGPTPDPKMFIPLREKIMNDGALTMTNRKHFGKDQLVPVNLVSPQVNVFEAEEINLIDDVIGYFKNINGNDASELSHTELAWIMADRGEKLPFYSYLLSAEAPTEEDMTWAKSRIN